VNLSIHTALIIPLWWPSEGLLCPYPVGVVLEA